MLHYRRIGTSTPGDVAESKAVLDVFGEHAYNNINSTKSMTGHLLGAAGAIEAVVYLAIKNSIVPPTINFEHPDGTHRPSFELYI